MSPDPIPDAPADAAIQRRAEVVRAALERVLVSNELKGSLRLAAFLRFVVEETLGGRADQIKGYTIAVEALDRPPTFDPQADPIVRVEATRLRRALQAYYGGEGADDPLRILVPKGGYVPVFEDRSAGRTAPAPVAAPIPAPAPAIPGREGEGALTPSAAAGGEAAFGPLAPAGGLAFAPVQSGLTEMEAARLVASTPAGQELAGQELAGQRPAGDQTSIVSSSETLSSAILSSAPRDAMEGPALASTATGDAPVSYASRYARHRGLRLIGYVSAGLATGLAILGLTALPSVLPFSGRIDSAGMGAQKVRLPIIEVNELGGADEAAPGLRRIEERLRDAFAQFDFVEVRADAAAAQKDVQKECNGPGARSVFALNGMVAPDPDGGTTLLLHLVDRCEGVIVWSAALEGTRGGGAIVEEQRMVRDVSAALMESYGVVPVRARSRVLAQAPHSGFGCIASAFAVLRGDGSAPRDVPRDCLIDLTTQDREFALGHAVRAAALLDAAMRRPQPVSKDEAALILNEAELAVDLAPASAFAARTLALTQLFLGETDAAIATGERALRLNPLDFDVAASVGQVFIGAGHVEKGEALLQAARSQGAARTPLQEAYLALAAFFRHDLPAVRELLPQLSLHPSPQNRIAMALAMHMLGRPADARAAIGLLAGNGEDEGRGADAVRHLVHHLLPLPDLSGQVLTALEHAGLPGSSAPAMPWEG